MPHPAPQQFGNRELTAREAAYVCGPIAAVGFARLYGRNPTLREAVSLAHQEELITEQTGMKGPQAQAALMQKMGLNVSLSGPDWARAAGEARQGVVISTPKHYFLATAYDPQKGYYVGNTGLALKGGSEWMTDKQIEAVAGPSHGMLFSTGGENMPPPEDIKNIEPLIARNLLIHYFTEKEYARGVGMGTVKTRSQVHPQIVARFNNLTDAEAIQATLNLIQRGDKNFIAFAEQSGDPGIVAAVKARQSAAQAEAEREAARKTYTDLGLTPPTPPMGPVVPGGLYGPDDVKRQVESNMPNLSTFKLGKKGLADNITAIVGEMQNLDVTTPAGQQRYDALTESLKVHSQLIPLAIALEGKPEDEWDQRYKAAQTAYTEALTRRLGRESELDVARLGLEGRRLGLDEERLGLERGRLGLEAEKFGIEYSPESIALDRRYKEAQIGRLEAQAEEQRRSEAARLKEMQLNLGLQAAGMMGNMAMRGEELALQASPWAIMPGQQHYFGFQPGGAASQLAKFAGASYNPDAYRAQGTPINTGAGTEAVSGLIQQLLAQAYQQ